MRETADPDDRMSEKLLEIVPESNRKPYDMYEVIREIVDDGEYFDIKPKFAKTIITCLARFGGQPVGIVANQPKQLGGILENDSADKAARFVNLCDAFEIPLVFLQDVPGFMVGSKVEHAGIIRHGAKMLYAISRATVPKVTVVVRKAYGAGYYVMNGQAPTSPTRSTPGRRPRSRSWAPRARSTSSAARRSRPPTTPTRPGRR